VVAVVVDQVKRPPSAAAVRHSAGSAGPRP
jgi:hypothetical protein